MGKLFLVPTPIGNLEDMTFRAIRILKEADVILAEDTRTSAPLLKHFGIDKKAYSHHQHNEHLQANLLPSYNQINFFFIFLFLFLFSSC